MANKVTIIAGSFVLVAAVVACVVVLVVNNKASDVKAGPSRSSGTTTSVKTVQSLCQPSSDRQTCETELTKAAGNKTDLKSLIRIALEIPRNYVVDTFNKSELLAAAAKDPENTVALEDCRRLFGYAIDNYDEALKNYDGWDITELYKLADDMDTVLSSAYTFQNDCKDSLKDKKNAAAQEITRILNISIPMSESAVKISKKVIDFANNNVSTMLQDLFGSGKRELAETAGGWSEPERTKVMDAAPWTRKPLVTVAQDGSGQFKTIMEGLAAMPTKNEDYVVMYIKEGVYNEKVEVGKNLNKLVVVGDGPTKTRVTGNLNVMMGKNISTFRTPTFAVIPDEFIAKDIGFENTAGAEGHQAVAFRSQSDKSVLYNCHFDGYQDTLYAHTQRQFYRDCTISGTVDFIFGDSISIFQNCKMVIRKPLPNQQNIVTAHGSKMVGASTVFVLQNCTITADPLLVPFIEKNPSYLGRPWKPYARTIVMQSYIDTVIHPDGWLPWPSEPDSINTCMYSEIDNRGPGADKSKRVKWPGVKTMSLKDANLYTVGAKFHEQTWPQNTGVPVIEGLLPPTQGADSQ